MRYALGIEYNGSGFHGWQAQSNGVSVQSALETALHKVADEPVTVICAGRTDTGVHARCQVVHFECTAQRLERQWILGLNSSLPDAVSVLWVRAVSEEFHARFSAIERRYRYTIANQWVRPAIRAGQVTWCRWPLDAAAMNRAAAHLLGEHDFSAFQSSGCSARHAVREVKLAQVERHGRDVVLDIAANGFLYHMVRNLVGSLIEVGRGLQEESWIAALLQGRDRKLAGVTASADGLCFYGVRYPASFGIPEQLPAFPEFTDQLAKPSTATGK